jgi:hypothetical protein
LDRFNILDPFLLSSTIFDNLIDCAYAMHDVDNTSEHETIIIKLLMESKYAGFIDRIYSSHISWPKATDSNIHDYRCAMSYKLEGITLPVDALGCHDLHCTNIANMNALYYLVSMPALCCPNGHKLILPPSLRKVTLLTPLITGLSL